MGSRKTGYAKFFADPRTFVAAMNRFRIVTKEERVSPPGVWTIEVPEELVAEILEYFMDEPVLHTVVRAKVKDVERPQIFERSNDHINGEGWYQAGDDTPYTWEHVSKLGEPEIVYDPRPDDEEDF